MSDQQTQPPEARETDQSAEELKNSQSSNVSGNQEPLQEAGCQSGVQLETFDLPDLGPEWHFNIFLSDLASSLSVDELKKVKCLFIEIIGKRALENIEIPEELFQTLRERRLISQDNLMLLQRCLYTLQRKDLIEKAVNFATTIGNCLYFYAADTQVNGFKHVKFHVEGKDFTNCTRTYLEEVRMKISKLLFLPIENVILGGVEPSSSMLITFLIPDMYANILESMIERKANFDDLYRSGIDTIIIGKHIHNIRGVEEVEVVESDQQAKLMNVYQQLKEKSELLDEAEVKLIQQTRTIKQLESQVYKDLKNAVVARTAERLFHNVVPNDAASAPCSPDTQNAFDLFVEALDRAEKQKMDRRVIQNLLDANTQIVANRVRDSCGLQIKQMSLQIQDLEGLTTPLQMELQKYKFFCQDNLDKIILDFYQKILESLQETHIVQSVTFNQSFLDLLKKISRSLRFREKEKLMKMYDWEQDDELKKAMDGDQTLILACILCKEIKETHERVDELELISKCLREIGRHDLEKKFRDHLLHPKQNKPKQRMRDTSPRPKSGENQLDQMADVLKDVSVKVDRIDEAIQSAKDVGTPQKNPYSASFDTSFCFPRYGSTDSESSGAKA